MTGAARARRACRIGWAIGTVVVLQVLVCGLSAMPVVFLWLELPRALERVAGGWRIFFFGLAVAPSYAAFALLLMLLSPLSVRLTGWRTPPNAEMRLIDAEWPLLDWVRGMVAIHVVRVLAGTLFRSTPVWTAYLRLAGARLGRRVYVNSLSLSDYNLIECGDDVIIGADAHISGHTVEAGVVKTAGVRLGRNVTIGLGSIIDIGVDIESHCQIGALTLVPKYSKLEAGGVYAGIPARRVGSARHRVDV